MAFSPQIPSLTFAPRDSSPSAHSQVKELPTDPDVKPSTLPPSKTFTCKDPEERHMFPFSSSLLTFAKDYQTDDADYTIRSSDVIDFKVHSYRLQAASPYFRALMKEDKRATSLCLAISGFHDALVVKNLLDIIYTSEPTGCQNIELAFQVITLATEWECEAVLKILKKDLTIQAGLAGSSAGIESPFFELGGFSYAEFLRLPPTVVWALARSTYLSRRDYGAVDVDAMAQHFETLLKSACKSLFFPYFVRLLTCRSSNRSAEGRFSIQGTVHSDSFSGSVFGRIHYSYAEFLSRSWAFRRRASKVIRPGHFHIK